MPITKNVVLVAVVISRTIVLVAIVVVAGAAVATVRVAAAVYHAYHDNARLDSARPLNAVTVNSF